jgi:histidinol-phosphatase (PHP family)
MIIADYHVHSDFSGDSQTPMEYMIDRALQLGLKKLCFTDHMDYDYPHKGGTRFEFDPELYVPKLQQLKEQYAGQIEILTGIELGLQPLSHVIDYYQCLRQKYSFDFAIGSTHVLDYADPYFPAFWEQRTPEQGIRSYFQSIIDNCKLFKDTFNIYGHLDYIIRYVPTKDGSKADYSYSDYADLLDEALKTIIHCGKGIEVNTAGYKYGFGYPHPKTEVLKRYRELGGELITIGSDAHKPEHLCYNFELVPELLKELGYTYYATFVQGKPVFEKL